MPLNHVLATGIGSMHCGAPSPGDIERIARLGVIPVAQPAFLTQFAGSLIEQLEESRAARVHPLAEYGCTGIPVAFSSDSPVSSHRPLDAVQPAVHRRGSGAHPIGIGQQLDPVDALRAHTRGDARSIFREHRFGELCSGYAADIAVTDRDIFSTSPDEIGSLAINCTIVSGAEVER